MEQQEENSRNKTEPFCKWSLLWVMIKIQNTRMKSIQTKPWVWFSEFFMPKGHLHTYGTKRTSGICDRTPPFLNKTAYVLVMEPSSQPGSRSSAFISFYITVQPERSCKKKRDMKEQRNCSKKVSMTFRVQEKTANTVRLKEARSGQNRHFRSGSSCSSSVRSEEESYRPTRSAGSHKNLNIDRSADKEPQWFRSS